MEVLADLLNHILSHSVHVYTKELVALILVVFRKFFNVSKIYAIFYDSKSSDLFYY